MEQITYIKSGDYYIPDWKLTEEYRPIGRWGRMHRDYLKEYRPSACPVWQSMDLSGRYQRTGPASDGSIGSADDRPRKCNRRIKRSKPNGMGAAR